MGIRDKKDHSWIAGGEGSLCTLGCWPVCRSELLCDIKCRGEWVCHDVAVAAAWLVFVRVMGCDEESGQTLWYRRQG